MKKTTRATSGNRIKRRLGACYVVNQILWPFTAENDVTAEREVLQVETKCNKTNNCGQNSGYGLKQKLPTDMLYNYLP